jgi:hypothetical protein
MTRNPRSPSNREELRIRFHKIGAAIVRSYDSREAGHRRRVRRVHNEIRYESSRCAAILVQWEQLRRCNAGGLLDGSHDQLCTPGGDIRGHRYCTADTPLAAVGDTGMPLIDQRVALTAPNPLGVGFHFWRQASSLHRQADPGGSPSSRSTTTGGVLQARRI